MSDVQVKYGDNAAGFANKLLSAARKLDVPTSVVRFSPDGHFDVPEEVADEAGVSFDVYDSPETTEVPEDPTVSADPPKSLGDDPETPVASGEEPNSEGKEESEPSTAGVEAPAEPEPELKGKALDEALEKAGLSKSGNKADKLARLAEHKNKE